MRDFYPDDALLQQYIKNRWVSEAERFGFQPMDASLLEYKNLYTDKTSEEMVDEQMYSFKDRGGREVALRPEMTPSIARMVSSLQEKRIYYPPLRIYSIANVFRYERQQKGRMREHWQLNADIYGVSGMEAEAELFSFLLSLFSSYGAKKNDIRIEVNDRMHITTCMKKIGIEERRFPAIYRILDKQKKMEKDEWIAELKKEITPHTEQFLSLLDGEVPLSIQNLMKMTDVDVVYTPSLVRGFNYYTGIVFEVFDAHTKKGRSLAGGGRYDNLTSLYGGTPTPSIGFGLGDITFIDFLKEHDLIPSLKPSADIFVTLETKEVFPQAKKIIKVLRDTGLSVLIDTTYMSIKKQYKKIEKERIPFILEVHTDTKMILRSVHERVPHEVSTPDDILSLVCKEL